MKKAFPRKIFCKWIKILLEQTAISWFFSIFYSMTNVSQGKKWSLVSHQQHFIQLLPNYVLKFPLSSPSLLDTAQLNSLIHRRKWDETRLRRNIIEASEHIFSKLSKEWNPVFHLRIIYAVEFSREYCQRLFAASSFFPLVWFPPLPLRTCHCCSNSVKPLFQKSYLMLCCMCLAAGPWDTVNL